MPSKTLLPIETLLTGNLESIVEEWVTEVGQAWGRRYLDLISVTELKLQAVSLLAELGTLFAGHDGDGSPQIAPESILARTAAELSASRAKLGFRPADTAQYLLLLKNVLTKRLFQAVSGDPAQLIVCLSALDDVLGRLSLLTFESYVETRERLIAQQSLSLLELSSPAIRLWDEVILLPLIGVIDTIRARQFTERLLEAIARHEATVTIIDVTGVPVFDTGVARHIMKAIDAAQLLGARIVMTGLSPEGAQTLTKLGIHFANVTSRASLRAGIAEALLMIGRRVTPVEGAS